MRLIFFYATFADFATEMIAYDSRDFIDTKFRILKAFGFAFVGKNV